MKKRLVSAAVTVALFIGLIAGVTFKASDKKEIKHFTAFFSVEGDNIDPDNDIKQLIAEQIGAECEETWLVGQDKDDAINSLIATGEYPDFVLGETALYEADALIPIDEYWDDYPNIKEYLSDEQWKSSDSRMDTYIGFHSLEYHMGMMWRCCIMVKPFGFRQEY